MIALNFLIRLLFETRWWVLVAAFYGLSLLKTGVWYIPNVGVHYRTVFDPLLQNVPEGELAPYYSGNFLSTAIAWSLGIFSEVGFVVLHFGFGAAFFFLVALLIRREMPDDQARRALVLFLCLPMSFTAHFWIGLDGLTLFLFALVFLFRRILIAVFVLGVLLGLQHFFQTAIAAALAIWAVNLARWFGFRLPVGVRIFWILFFGIFLGRAVLEGVYFAVDAGPRVGRIDWLLNVLGTTIRETLLGLPAVFWSVLGIGWLFLIRNWDLGRAGWAPTLTILSILPLALAVGDQTRVLAIVMTPALLVMWLLNREVVALISRRAAAGALVLWLVLPMAWVWGGQPRWSVLPYDIGLGLHHATGGDLLPLPNSVSNWPFFSDYFWRKTEPR